MIFKHILWFLLLITSVFAQEAIKLESNFIQIDHTHQKTLITKERQISLEQILTSKAFNYVDKSNFKASNNIYWTKIALQNTTNKARTFYFQNPRASLDKIDVYVFKNHDIIAQHHLGDLRAMSQREVQSRKSSFKLLMQPNQTYTIISRYESLGGITTHWQIKTSDKFLFDELIDMLTWGLFAGIILILIFYNLVIYNNIQEKSFIYYICFAIAVMLLQLNLNGVIHLLQFSSHLEFLNYMNWILSEAAFAFLILFPIYFFKLAKSSKLYKYFYTLFVIECLLIVTLSYAFIDNKILSIVTYANIFHLVVFASLLYLSFWAIKKNKDGAIYYAIGQVIYIGLMMYYIMVIIGILEGHQYSWLAIPFSVIFDVIFISLSLNIKISAIQKQKSESEKMIISQSRFLTMGQSIANLTHQWKIPISQVASQVFVLKATKELNKKELYTTLDEFLVQMQESIDFLNESMNDIYNIYANPNDKERFFIHTEIERVLNIFKTKMSIHNIHVDFDYESMEYYGYKNSFLNIIISIMENAIYALNTNNPTTKNIHIRLFRKDSKIVIFIEDSAGGICTSHVNEIFHIDYSTKQNKGSGIGLALTKKLVEKRLHGSIEVENINQGARFTITLHSNTFIA